jgi:hypothetical protein
MCPLYVIRKVLGERPFRFGKEWHLADGAALETAVANQVRRVAIFNFFCHALSLRRRPGDQECPFSNCTTARSFAGNTRDRIAVTVSEPLGAGSQNAVVGLGEDEELSGFL